MNFQLRHHNRKEFPTKHIVIAEDDIIHQAELMVHFSHMFDRQGKVRISLVCGAAAVASIINTEPVDLLVLDFDMPFGNSPDLIQWMVENDKKIPVITATGWAPNLPVFEQILKDASMPYHLFDKFQVIKGDADKVIHDIIGEL